MGVRYDRRWVTDQTGEHLRVDMTDGDRRVEVCRLVPGETDDRTGCALRAVILCEALADHIARQEERRSGGPVAPG